MKPEGMIFWAIPMAAVMGAIHWWTNYDFVEFDEPEHMQFNRPQIELGTSRVGRRVIRMKQADLGQGDLVRFKTRRTKRVLTARILAVQGQRVKIEGTKIQVDGADYDDDFIRYKNQREYMPEIIVPRDCVFVINDTRWRSGADRMDSRAFGPIPVSSIKHRFSPKRREQSRRRAPTPSKKKKQ